MVLKRPELILSEKENAAELKQTMVEMSIIKDKDFTTSQWVERFVAKKSKGKGLTPLELKFLSLVEHKNHIEDQKNKLNVVSPVDGHAGEVNLNVGQTVSPYTSIITLYQSQPAYVKSYIPESFDLTRFNQSRKSMVKSMSREVEVAGKIVTVGTILTELPQRFQKDPMNKLFGREIKIELPKDNGLYLGEKVYVSVEEI